MLCIEFLRTKTELYVKVWSREIERAGGVATLEGLLKWMSCEMKLRMRATAPLRSVAGQQRGGVYQLSVNGNEKIRHKCWLCKNSDQWPDQCTKFAALTYENRLKEAKENHVCYSCLKQAGRKHNAANCNRRKRCNKSENGQECQAFHHPLLHKPNPVNVVAASEVQNTSVILPVVTANICGQNGLQKQANVLLDTGAKISLIRNDPADLLGLVGKDTHITITKVGGEGENMKTKVYKVPV